MTDAPATLIADPRAQLAAATDLASKTQAALTRAERTLSTIVQRGARDFAQSLPDCTLPFDPHRAAHRPGTRPKIASDPELQAFIAARITRMTFDQLAEEVAKHFPKDRRVGRSTIHLWWQNSGRTPDRTGHPPDTRPLPVSKPLVTRYQHQM